MCCLTYVTDPQLLTPSHLLYGWRIGPVTHLLDDPEELKNLTYINGSNTGKRVRRSTHSTHQSILVTLEKRIFDLIEGIK